MKKTAKSSDSRSTPEDGASILDPRAQSDLFSKAMQRFQAGEYRKAQTLFNEAAAGPGLPMAESARMYARICEQRTGAQQTEPQTAEECYTYGVALINRREYLEALPHLRKAYSLLPNAPHVLYALSLVQGLTGDVDSSRNTLKRAIDLDPTIRRTIRNDSDFQSLLDVPGFRDLIAISEPAAL